MIAVATTLLDWQQSTWQHLHAMRERMPHALLLYGQSGIGKLNFAQVISKRLLCKSPDLNGVACDTCQSCHWFDEGSHPDFRVVSPEEEQVATENTKKKAKINQNITVAQVRGLSDFVNLTSHHDKGYRIVLIQPAEAMNLAAANALLKMLEEPAQNAIFILVSHQRQRLLPTILSRCHQVSMPIPTVEQSMNWLGSQNIGHAAELLAYYASAPLKVVEASVEYAGLQECWKLLAQGSQISPAVLATKLLAHSADSGMLVLQKWLFDIVLIQNTGQIRYHMSQMKALQALASRVNLNALFALQKKVEALRKLATHPLNHELQLEVLLLEYSKLFSTK